MIYCGILQDSLRTTLHHTQKYGRAEREDTCWGGGQRILRGCPGQHQPYKRPGSDRNAPMGSNVSYSLKSTDLPQDATGYLCAGSKAGEITASAFAIRNVAQGRVAFA